MVNIGIIILNYNSEKVTKECLDSLVGINKKDLNIRTLLIDNGSKNPLKINVNQYADIKLETIFNENNLGFSGGVNTGFTIFLKERLDYILVLNNDTIHDPEFLINLVDFMQKSPDVLGASPKIYFASGFEFHKDRYRDKEKGKVVWYAGGIMDWSNLIGHHRGVDEVDIGQYQDDNITDFLTGCCMILRPPALEKIGIFDERYFLYYEDADLSERLKLSGGKIKYVPESTIWHKNASSAGGSGSGLQDYYITRNRMLFGFKFAPLRTKLALVRESLSILATGRRWQRRGIMDFYSRRMGKGSYE